MSISTILMCKVATEYSKGKLSLKNIAEQYDLTYNTVRQSVKEAILLSYINLDIAHRIKSVAVKHTVGYSEFKVANYYDNLFSRRKEIAELQQEFNYLESQIRSYDDNEIPDDDPIYTKEDLKRMAESLRIEIKVILEL